MNGLWATRRGTHLVRKGFAFAVFALASASASAAPAIDEEVPDRGIFSLRPAPRWEEGLLIGNGRMGGVVLGRPGHETIHLSHERVVIPNHVAEPPPNLAHLLPETRRLIREGKRQEAAQMVWEESRRIAGWNGLVWTDPFVNACNLEIKLPGLAERDAYRRSIDYETGVARVQWVGGETRYEERAFLSRPDNIMVLELTAAGKKKLAGIVSLKAGAHPYHHRIKDEQLLSEEGWLTYRCGYKLTDGGYEVIGRVESDGTYANEGDSIRFSGARRVRVLLRIVPLDGSADSQFDKTKAALKSLGRKSFAELLATHVAVHGELFRRVKLDLSSDVAERTMPAEDLWKKTHKAEATPALLERVFDAGRYQVICSTGDWPPNLQGVWHGGGTSAWMGDFTLNGNVQSAIAHYLNGNLPELLLSFTSYLEERIPQFRANAKNLYNCRGILVPGRSHNSVTRASP